MIGNTAQLYMIQGVALLTGLAALAHLLHARTQRSLWENAGLALLFCAFAVLSLRIGQTWQWLGRPPLKTLCESLLAVSWLTMLILLGIHRWMRMPWLRAGVLLAVAGLLAYAAWHPDLDRINLPPSLQSPWFIPHVLVYLAAYGCLLLAAVGAAVHLLAPQARWQRWRAGVMTTESYATFMHQFIVIGYVLLSIGMVIGMVWAKQAWGNYWAWDPKENWALVSWIVFTLYFHVWRLPGWRDQARAWVVLLGICVIAFTYVGISLLPTADGSVHTYQ